MENTPPETNDVNELKSSGIVRPIPTYREIRSRAGTEVDCRTCGHCCEASGGDLLANSADVSGWLATGRMDILRYVKYECHPDGSLKTFDPEIWKDPESQFDQQMSRCPFLVVTREEGFRCGIYPHWPAVCPQFELDGPRCQQIREKRMPRRNAEK